VSGERSERSLDAPEHSQIIGVGTTLFNGRTNVRSGRVVGPQYCERQRGHWHVQHALQRGPDVDTFGRDIQTASSGRNWALTSGACATPRAGAGAGLARGRRGRSRLSFAKTRSAPFVGNLPPGRCPFFALSVHQNAANASKRRHKAKVENRGIPLMMERDPATSSTRAQRAANASFSAC
jgi:hypothetical protein